MQENRDWWWRRYFLEWVSVAMVMDMVIKMLENPRPNAVQADVKL